MTQCAQHRQSHLVATVHSPSTDITVLPRGLHGQLVCVQMGGEGYHVHHTTGWMLSVTAALLGTIAAATSLDPVGDSVARRLRSAAYCMHPWPRGAPGTAAAESEGHKHQHSIVASPPKTRLAISSLLFRDSAKRCPRSRCLSATTSSRCGSGSVHMSTSISRSGNGSGRTPPGRTRLPPQTLPQRLCRPPPPPRRPMPLPRRPRHARERLRWLLRRAGPHRRRRPMSCA